MKSAIYNTEGKEVSTTELPERIFGLPWNADLVYQVVVSMQANARAPFAHTKDRSDVRGGGRKPWKQKGTGRARHGSRTSPIWRGGGITFGPRNEKDFSKKINKKMSTKALYTTLSRKLKDNELVFVDTFAFGTPKSSTAKAALTALSKTALEGAVNRKKNAVLIALPERDEAVEKSFRNFGNVSVAEVRSLNPVAVLSYKYVVIANPEKAIETLAGRTKGRVVKAGTEKKTTRTAATAETTANPKAATAARTKKAPAKKATKK